MRQLIIILSCVWLSACASYYGSARITSVPTGAEIISDKDGTVIGVTPTTAWWKEDSSNRQHIILRFKKDGYYEKVTSFWLSMRHKKLSDAKNNTQKVEVVLQKRGK